MLQEFVDNFPEIKIKSVLADTLYCSQNVMDNAALITGKTQVISQLTANKIVSSKNQTPHCRVILVVNQGGKCHLVIRGGKTQTVTVTMLAVRLHVKAHGKRRYVVALKSENEYRYLVPSDLSWQFY